MYTVEVVVASQDCCFDTATLPIVIVTGVVDIAGSQSI